MKALTLWRPWTWSIVHGPKRIENRPWKPPASIIGQRLVLHSGKTYDDEGSAYIRAAMKLTGLPDAARAEGLIGVVTVKGFIEEGVGPAPVEQDAWFFGPFGWMLDDVVALKTPIPCKGAQGLWTLTPELERQVLEQLAVAA